VSALCSQPDVAVVVGARPNFAKAAVVCHALRETGALSYGVIHTGQHYDEFMSTCFFDELDLDPPAHNLGIRSGSDSQQVGRVLLRLAGVLEDMEPRVVVVFGDVNSTLGAALCAAQAGIPILHVEAGLRSHDDSVEERNRILISRLAAHHLAPCEWSVRNLVREGVPQRDVEMVGSTLACMSLRLRHKVERATVLRRFDLRDGGYAIVTAHKRSITAERSACARLVRAIAALGRRIPTVFPIHPATREVLESAGMLEDLAGIALVDPVTPLDMTGLMLGARAVLTDSDGLQDETTALGVRCFTFAPASARTATLVHGTNELVDLDDPALPERVAEAEAAVPSLPRHWDLEVGARIAETMERAVTAASAVQGDLHVAIGSSV
jgi:UDP-N-acetylglucosamine 2-epimerase (non-hydrolysing)